jgi:hypothetical protein
MQSRSAFAGSPLWCKVLNYHRFSHEKDKGNGESLKMQNAAAVRASISFPAALYETLEDIAKHKKVSMAWVVRDAAEKYVASEAKEETRTI